MNREDRAKQFMAFDALKGLREELKRREEKRLKVQKKELSEEQTLELSQSIATLKKGDSVKVVFFYSGYYVELQGVLQGINLAYKYLEVCDNKISFSDVSEIQKT